MKSGVNAYRFLILWALCLAGIFACDTEKNVEDPDLDYFVKYYGSDGDQKGVDMHALADGSFLLLGNYWVNDFDSEIYLVRVNAEGDVIWEKRFKGEIADNIVIAKDLEPTGDGNFIVVADFQQSIGDLADIKLLKISPDGVPLDSAVFGTAANDFSRTVTLLDDGGFIISGTTEFTGTWGDVNNPDPDLGDFVNYRSDQNLDLLSPSDWFPVSPGFGGKLDVAVKAVQMVNEYYVFGYSNIELSNTNPEKKIGLIYFIRDQNGGGANPFFPGNSLNVDTQIQFVQALESELGNGFVVIGSSQDNFGNSKIFLAKLRNQLTGVFNNDAILYESLPLNRNIRGISAAPSLAAPVGFLVVGNEVRSTGVMNIWLSKIDQSGNVIWSSTFGSELKDDSGAAVRELPDGKIVILGTMGLADNQTKMAFIKVNPRGQLLR